MGRIIIVSNRLPITIDRKQGELIYHPSAGGLATGLGSLDQNTEKLWIGWPGKVVESEKEQDLITEQFKKDGMFPVFLSNKEIELFYEGFSNKTIWPHFHYFTQYTAYDDESWEVYKSVNEKFARVVASQIWPDDMVWVHDYQLMLVPGILRRHFPDISIGFFLHIPFPSYEIFRTLPWRKDLLNGVLGADQIGFHTFGYMRHFLSAAYRISGIEHSFGKLIVEGRSVNVDVFPMGIDYEKYAFPNVEDSESEEVQFIKNYGQKRKLILSIDRLDYSKGIPERIRAYELFLERNPEYRGIVTLMLVVVPSRANVDQYRSLKVEIDKLVGRINGTYGTFNWIPIRYYYRSFAFESLVAMYQAAHIALITPLRDGMNLVAKEYVATKQGDKPGVLILSEMAGAANELTEAIIINPKDQNDIEQALLKALETPHEVQRKALEEMQRRLQKYNVKHWANNFIKQQMEVKKFNQDRQTKLLSLENKTEMLESYKKSKSSLILLDYDGTLVGFKSKPEDAFPDEELVKQISEIHKRPNTTVVIISGRDRYTLEKWFGAVGIEIVSEHGVWLWDGTKWNRNESVIDTWKPTVMPFLEDLVERTPGSFIEEKDYTLAWHYRQIDNDLGVNRVREIRDELIYLTSNHDLQVLEGNKVVEIRNAGVNKGKAAGLWLGKKNWDFIMAVGDDHTDEDTFLALPPEAYTIKVGLNKTSARFKVKFVEDVRSIVKSLAES
ncbi:MAG: bifunctional alpha,alpha-trehalose-phosphate synthase (UDP-forming)/trehalose-phosphatase [Bacteroidia bacterium]|nr:bifunctional alpha,alpha-trehalose-phosphate synthase (UDP-forming)/trehalose-phosphatase [Bacteroidia bacterium]